MIIGDSQYVLRTKLVLFGNNLNKTRQSKMSAKNKVIKYAKELSILNKLNKEVIGKRTNHIMYP